MKLRLISISTAILLLATSSFASQSVPTQPVPTAPAQPIPSQGMQPQVTQPQIGQLQQGQDQATSPTETQNQAPVPVKKKIDPKLQQKLDVKVDDVSEEEYQKIVGEYKKYLRDVPSTIRQEVREYRKEVVRINKDKTALYKKLSQEAQKFLAKEREIKRKLPIHNQAIFAKEIRHSEAE